MKKNSIILGLTMILFTGLLNAQKGFTQKEKKQILDKYRSKNSTFHPSSKEFKVIYEYLKNQDTKEIEEDFWKHNKRLPTQERAKKRENVPPSKLQKKKRDTITLPEDARFPGEYEEIQGVFVNYPYSSGAVVITEGTNEEPSLAKFFRELIHAIQEAGVTAYISIRNEADKAILIQYFKDKGTPLTNYQFLVNPTDSIWTRDFGPIDFYYGDDDKIGWVDLKYYNSRELDDALTPIWAKNFKIEHTYMPLDFEGGNILMNGHYGMATSSRVYTNNSDYSESEVRDLLKKSFNLKDLYILGDLKFDGGTGHVDLYIDMINENSFVYTKQPLQMANIPEYKDYQTVLDNVDFLKTKTSPGGGGNPYVFNTVPFPTQDDQSIYDDADIIDNTNRTYSNHLIINKTIIQPVFNNGQTGNIEGDKAALDILRKKYPGYKFITIDGRTLEGSGGSIHCVTKEFHAENPIRFKHYSYHGLIDDCKSSYPVNVVITNKSGIKEAVLFSRIKGTNVWNQTKMTEGEDNHWQSAITLPSTLSGNKVEYYISATSNNGKTMTYPMTGAEGGAYTFWCTSSCTKEITMDTMYKESFEGSLGDWGQDTNDDIDWLLTKNNNQTGVPSASDGEYSISVQTPAGTPNKKAILKSPCFDLSGASFASFDFDYHMGKGSDDGDLYLEASDDNGFSWKRVWEATINQEEGWLSVNIDLQEYVGETVQLRFNYATGKNSDAYIAIDKISFDVRDTQAPTAPENLVSSNVTQTSLTLTWTASTDDISVKEYGIYEGGTKIGTTSETTYTVLDYGETAEFTVKARDKAGNISEPSNKVTVTGGLAYCKLKGEKNGDDYITNVSFAGIDNTSKRASKKYQNYTLSTAASVSREESYNLKVTFVGYKGGAENEVYAWFDWNIDGDFMDDGEKYKVTNKTSDNVRELSINVPSSAKKGITRMRIVLGDDEADVNSGNPCGTFKYGEVEDYTLDIDSGGGTVNTLPKVNITSPSNGTVIEVGNTIGITASASDSDGNITKVEFFNGSIKLGEDTSSPYSFDWSNIVEGSYNLTAIATDNDGGSTTSSTVNVTVTSPVPDYCRANGDSGTEAILQVRFGEINNTSVRSSSGYEDYTDISTNVNVGSAYSLTVDIEGYKGGESDEVYAWFDWNRDGDFNDENEFLKLDKTNNTTGRARIRVPNNTQLGATRMRIRVAYYAASNKPCGSVRYGEVEDYTLVITNDKSVEIDLDEIITVSTYPNPITNGEMNVNFNTSQKGIAIIQLFDLTGKKVFETIEEKSEEQVRNVKINTDLPAGFYILKTKLGNSFKQVTNKVIIQ